MQISMPINFYSVHMIAISAITIVTLLTKMFSRRYTIKQDICSMILVLMFIFASIFTFTLIDEKIFIFSYGVTVLSCFFMYMFYFIEFEMHLKRSLPVDWQELVWNIKKAKLDEQQNSILRGWKNKHPTPSELNSNQFIVLKDLLPCYFGSEISNELDKRKPKIPKIKYKDFS